MAKLKTTRPAGKEAVVFVYMTDSEKAELQEAAAREVAGIPGAKLPVYEFVRAAALERARRDIQKPFKPPPITQSYSGPIKQK